MTARSEIVIIPPNQLFVFDKKALRKTFRQTGAEIAALAKRKIRQSGTGLRRPRSLPGGPPASLTGTLIRSIRVIAFKSGEGVAVRATAFYAVMLEGGAQGGEGSNSGRGKKNAYQKRGRVRSRVSVVGRRVLLPRPFLSTALDEREASLGKRVQDAITVGVAFKRIKP